MAKKHQILDGPRMAYGPVKLEKRRSRVPVLRLTLLALCLVLAAAIVLTLAGRYGWFPVPGWFPAMPASG